MLRSFSNRRNIILICLASLLLAGIFAVYAQRRPERIAPGWLQSQAATVQLGVWNKSGPQKAFDAVFIVTGADGNQYKSERHTNTGDEWVYTMFPQEFDKYPEGTGRYSTYSWKCVVEGKTVASGQFQWGNNRAGAP